jgi:hypothetical protein
MAAAHKQGPTAVHRYFDAASNGTLGSPPSPRVGQGWENIEGRLRYAEDLSYDSDANAREANTGKTGSNAPKKK